MTDVTASPSADELFQKWKQFLDSGTQTSANEVAAEHPQLIPAVQRLIDHYLMNCGTGPGSTLTGPVGVATMPKAPDIPGYVVEKFLGGGGMGEVWRVRNQLDRRFALKLVRPDRLSAVGRQRFLAEAKAMDQLDHPHVARFHHYEIHNDLPFILMRPYPASLKDRVAVYQANPRAAVRLLAAVADGVGYLHSRGMVHRDLKPGNVLIDEAGQPAVSDFGLVKSLTDDGASDPGDPASGSAETRPTGARGSKTIDGVVLGTRSYMSPEQAGGRTTQANPRWDVWALGVMLHELVVGQLPASSENPERLLNPHHPDNRPPSTWKSDLDPALERIIQKCLARASEDRYPNGAAVARDLSSWLARKERRWTYAIIVAVFLTATAVTAGIAHYSHRPEPPAPPGLAEVLTDLQQRLAAGHEVTVIGPTGNPLWSDVAVGREIVRPFVSDIDATFTVDSSEVVLIDLPPTGLQRYEFAVDIDSRTTGGHFGVYSGRHSLPTRTGGTVECFNTLWFNDADPRGPGGRWTLGTRSYVRVANAGGILNSIEPAHGEYSPNKAPAKSTWHRLSVAVDPEGANWTFDGAPAGRTPFQLPAKDLSAFAKMANLNAGVRPAFSTAGGYGIMVYGGSAAFRNGTIRPLNK